MAPVELPGSFDRRSVGASEGGRGDLAFHELSRDDARRFHDAVVAAKTAGKFGAAITAHTPEDYAEMRIFATADGKVGVAIKSDGDIAFFKHPAATANFVADSALALAVREGGDRVDTFDTALPAIYSANGFRAVARLSFDPKLAPADWDYKRFAKFNGARPDIVFMVFDPKHSAGGFTYQRNDGRVVKNYAEGVAEQAKELAKLAKAKDWAALRAQSLELLAFDPDQPRDEGGRWTASGSEVDGLPDEVKIHDATLSRAIHRGAWNVTAKPRGFSSDKPGDAYRVDISARPTADTQAYKTRESDTSPKLYNPKFAHLEVEDKGDKWERTRAVLNPGLKDQIEPLPDKDVIYRGISAEEYKAIQDRGAVTSNGEYNVQGQEGLTYWTTEPATADAYANGFAPWPMKPTFEKPAYVIAAKRPDEKDIRSVPGTGENEVGVARPIDKSEIVGVWRGDAYDHRPGNLDLLRIGYDEGNDYRVGSSSAPSTSVAWSRIDEHAEKAAGTSPVAARAGAWAALRAQSLRLLAKDDDFDESKHPRDEAGRFTESGGGDGGAAPSGAEEEPLLVSSHPNQEKLDRWTAEISARQKELADQGQAGNKEDEHLNRMQMALNAYMQEPDESLKSGNAGLNTTYDLDGHLKGAAFASIGKQQGAWKPAVIHYFGAVSPAAHLKTLRFVDNYFDSRVSHLEATERVDDKESIALFEKAGFRQVGDASGGIVRLQKGTGFAEHSAKIHGAAQATARLLGYDPDLVEVSSEDSPFQLGGHTYYAAGLAHLDTGKIELFPARIGDVDAAVGTTAHEVAHQKYQKVLNAVQAEREKVMANPDTLQSMNADGSLNAPLDKKYPLYSRFVKHDNSVGKRIKDDGITMYSREWWAGYTASNASKDPTAHKMSLSSPQHETIAEMARRFTETGELKGSPTWRAYYRDIMKSYDELYPRPKINRSGQAGMDDDPVLKALHDLKKLLDDDALWGAGGKKDWDAPTAKAGPEDEPRDEGGKWTSGGGGDGGAAEPEKPESIAEKADRIVDSVPGAREKIAAAQAKLSRAVPTDASVAQGGYKMANGQYTPERQAVHDALIKRIFTAAVVNAAKPAAGEKPAIHFLGGSGGSGKSWFTGKNGTIDKSKALYINSDDIKEALPEYQGWNAAMVHEESSDISKRVEAAARSLGLNIILDGTMSGLGSLDKRIGQYRQSGYQVHGHFMRVKPETSVKRAVERYMRGGEKGRLVNPAMILESNNVQNFKTLSPKMDSSEMYDNEGAAPVLVSRSEPKRAFRARL